MEWCLGDGQEKIYDPLRGQRAVHGCEVWTKLGLGIFRDKG